MAILNDILDLSKIEAEKVELHTSDFSPADAVEDVVDLSADRARRKGIEICALVERDVPGLVRGDEMRFRQVLVNLISNGVKFTDHGDVKVRIGVEEQTERGSWVRVTVEDTGIGIDAHTADRLFESFTQADSSTTRQYGGTGLGLTISKQLVELMGGTIQATGVPGRGSTFSFTIPFASVEPGAERDAGAEAPHGGSGRRLLVADESESTRQAVVHWAAGVGIDAEQAVDASDAVRRMSAAASAGLPFDTVVLGARLVNADGDEVTAAAASNPAPGGTYIVVIGTPMERPRDLAAHGAAAFVSKPLRRSRLREALLDPGAASPDPPGRADARPDDLDGLSNPALSVLVAEDDSINQRLAAGLLDKRGVRAHVVSNGREALEALEHGSYAAVLMDCQLPGVDGYEATRELRRLERERRPRRHVPVIAMTANAMSGDRERCLAAGMDDHLGKPLDVEAFDAALVRWVTGDRASTGVADPSEGELPGDPRVEVRDRFETLEAEAETVALLRDELGEAFVTELWNGVLEQAPQALAEMRAATARNDPDALAAGAHTLAGSAATVGASAIAAAARALEHAGRSSDLTEARPLLDLLEEAIRDMSLALTLDTSPALEGAPRGGYALAAGPQLAEGTASPSSAPASSGLLPSSPYSSARPGSL